MIDTSFWKAGEIQPSFLANIDLNDYILVTGYKLWVQNGLSPRPPIEGIFFQDHFQLQAPPLLQSFALHRLPHGPTLF